MTLTATEFFSSAFDRLPDGDKVVEVTEASGCRILSAGGAGLSQDVWEAVPRPFDNFIAILQYQPPAQTKGGIWLPQGAQDDCETLGFVGQVLAMGPNCYRRDTFMVVEEYLEPGEWNGGQAPAVTAYRRYLPPPRCKVGDWVVFQRHEQFRAPVYGRDAQRSEAAITVRFTLDHCILAAAPYPDQLKVYLV